MFVYHNYGDVRTIIIILRFDDYNGELMTMGKGMI